MHNTLVTDNSGVQFLGSNSNFLTIEDMKSNPLSPYSTIRPQSSRTSLAAATAVRADENELNFTQDRNNDPLQLRLSQRPSY